MVTNHNISKKETFFVQSENKTKKTIQKSIMMNIIYDEI